MDFADEIRAFALGIPEKLEYVRTEEATKTALVLPFLRAMGYNTADPREVVPEFIADFGVKKADRVDFAILHEGRPIIVIECKPATANLDDEHVAQLFAYFAATETRFGVLTNGVVYRWYSDLDRPNQMDHRPFLEANLLEVNDALIEELRRFSKTSFDLKDNVEAATQLKYTKEIKRILSEELREPSDNFVRLFASQIYSGKMMKSVMDRFSGLTRQAFNEFINDRVHDRINSALRTEGNSPPNDMANESASQSSSISNLETHAPADGANAVDTTLEEFQAYYIVKAILHDVVDVNRVTMRNRTGLGNSVILLDDSQVKIICRLRFSGSRKHLGLLDEQKREQRVSIDVIDDIYSYEDRLKAAVLTHEHPSPHQTSPEGDIPSE